MGVYIKVLGKYCSTSRCAMRIIVSPEEALADKARHWPEGSTSVVLLTLAQHLKACHAQCYLSNVSFSTFL